MATQYNFRLARAPAETINGMEKRSVWIIFFILWHFV